MTRPFCTSTLAGGWANLHSVSGLVHLLRWNSLHTSSCSHRESLPFSRLFMLTIAILPHLEDGESPALGLYESPDSTTDSLSIFFCSSFLNSSSVVGFSPFSVCVHSRVDWSCQGYICIYFNLWSTTTTRDDSLALFHRISWYYFRISLSPDPLFLSHTHTHSLSFAYSCTYISPFTFQISPLNCSLHRHTLSLPLSLHSQPKSRECHRVV